MFPVTLELEKVRRHHKRRKDTDLKENTKTATDTREAPPSTDLQAPQSTDLQAQPSTDRQTTPGRDFDFTMYVLSSVSVLKIGSLSFVDSCSSPFIICRILKSNLGNSVQVAGVRCLCDGGKVLSVFCNFQVTIDFSFWVFVPVTVLRFVCQVCPVKLVNMHSWSNSCLFITRKELWKCFLSERVASSCLGGSNAPSCAEWHFS